jgi:salicylate hydroxylase
MAVEDAAALAASLGHLQKIEDLGRILGVFEQIRKTRTSQMQQASEINAKLLHFADGPEQQARDAAMEAEVLGIDFEESANQWSDPKTQEWAYGFDAVETINKVLA